MGATVSETALRKNWVQLSTRSKATCGARRGGVEAGAGEVQRVMWWWRGGWVGAPPIGVEREGGGDAYHDKGGGGGGCVQCQAGGGGRGLWSGSAGDGSRSREEKGAKGECATPRGDGCDAAAGKRGAGRAESSALRARVTWKAVSKSSLLPSSRLPRTSPTALASLRWARQRHKPRWSRVASSPYAVTMLRRIAARNVRLAVRPVDSVKQ